MAGIGFEFKKILKQNSYHSLFRAYIYAGLIGSGPWIFSIIGVLIVGIISLSHVIPTLLVSQFQISLTYIFAFSLMLTGFLQLAFTRFIADLLFQKHYHKVLPNFHAIIVITIIISSFFAIPLAYFLFPNESILYRLLMIFLFITECNIWMSTIFLTGMKHYKAILITFFVGYTISTLSAISLNSYGIPGLLAGFWIGQAVLLICFMLLVFVHYPSTQFLSFECLKKGKMIPKLMLIGFLYNLGIWIDKLIFWFSQETSIPVIGYLRASPIYDLPIFLAYLSIIPGMAVFLIRIETDFVEYYDKFYNAVREGETLRHIQAMRNEMVFIIQQGIFDIIKIQSIAVLTMFILGSYILDFLHISLIYTELLYIDLIAVAIQVVFLGVLNVLFYLDERSTIFYSLLIFCSSNTLFTLLSLILGPPFYGYGFAFSLLLSTLYAFYKMGKKLDMLEFETFMLQR